MTWRLYDLDPAGIEKLIFQVTEETNFIVFHSKNITITSRFGNNY